jgi:hypothetical protein
MRSHTHAGKHSTARKRTNTRTHARTHARTHTYTHTHTTPPPLPHPQVFNENDSPFYDDNMAAAPKAALEGLSPDDLIEANKKYSINGYLWCNAPGMALKTGDRRARARARGRARSRRRGEP